MLWIFNFPGIIRMSVVLLCFHVQSPGDGSCGVLVGGASQAFAQCQPLISNGSGLRLGWSLASDAKVEITFSTRDPHFYNFKHAPSSTQMCKFVCEAIAMNSSLPCMSRQLVSCLI